MPSPGLDTWSAPWLGAAMVGFCLGHSLLLWRGYLKERGLGQVLAAGTLQGLGLLACLSCPWPEPIPFPVNLLLLAGAGYGLWALRSYAGVPARLNRWGWLALGAWIAVALAFQGMGFRWVRGLVVPAALTVLALGMSRDLARLPGRVRLPAQVSAGLTILLAFCALGAGLTTAAFLAETGLYTAPMRTWFFFGVLVAHQGALLLLGQVQGQRVQARLEGLTATDPVTGLASARGFRDRLDRAVARSLRTGRVTSLLVLDLDDFEAMVREHGPTQVDHLQEAFAGTLTATLREADLAGRLGEGRFAALLHQTPPEEALLAAERLRSTWENVAVSLGSRTFRATLSGGVASTRESINGTSALLALAMGRAIAARMGGGNDVEGETPVYESMEAN